MSRFISIDEILHKNRKSAPIIKEAPVKPSTMKEEATYIVEKPVDVKPIDESPVDVKPIDESPVDVKPIDESPVDIEPVVESKPKSKKAKK